MKTKELFDKTFRITLISSIICFIFGLLVFMETDLAIETVSIMLGVILIALSIYIVVRYFLDGALRYFFGYSLLYGLLDFIVGIIMIINPNIISIVIAIFITINLLVEFITKIQVALLFRKYNIEGWIFQIILSILLFICAIIIIINPVEGMLAVTKVIASIIMLTSILNIIDCFIIRRKVRDLKKSLKEIFE